MDLSHEVDRWPAPYTLDPALRALQGRLTENRHCRRRWPGRSPVAGILMAELMRRCQPKCTLAHIFTSMMTQLQRDIWNRFTITLTRLDFTAPQWVRNQIPSDDSTEQGIGRCWLDILHRTNGTKAFLYNRLSGRTIERTAEYTAPCLLLEREEGSRVTWEIVGNE